YFGQNRSFLAYFGRNRFIFRIFRPKSLHFQHISAEIASFKAYFGRNRSF
ncbi:hypothetical protein T09_1633, partial [Trichinella sp. T9]